MATIWSAVRIGALKMSLCSASGETVDWALAAAAAAALMPGVGAGAARPVLMASSAGLVAAVSAAGPPAARSCVEGAVATRGCGA